MTDFPAQKAEVAKETLHGVLVGAGIPVGALGDGAAAGWLLALPWPPCRFPYLPGFSLES